MKNPLVHETAIVEEGFLLGERTKVWHFSHLMSGSQMGSDGIVGQNVFIDKNVIIGSRVKIQNNVSIYNGVTIEDDVFIGPSAVFTNVINPRSFIDRKNEFLPTLVKKGATIGANATIICGIEIGEYALVGAGSVVTSAVKPFALVYGNPAKQKGWISKNGYRLIFNEKGEGSCSYSGEKYLLKGEVVTIS